MDSVRYFLSDYWLVTLLGALALVLGGVLVLRRQRGQRPSRLLVVAAPVVGLLALGGWIVPPLWAWWATALALCVLIGMILVLVTTGRWSAIAAAVAAGIAVAGIGGLAIAGTAAGLTEVGRAILNVEVSQPWWLLLLVLVPVIIGLSFRSLAGLGPNRRWLAIGLRCALVILLTLALAEARLRHPNENVTVMFLVDRSLSVPEEWETDPKLPGKRLDRRWERIKRFINESVEKRGPGSKSDKTGVIIFGRRPRLELPPSDAPRLNFTEVTSPVDSYYTDIAAAMKLAFASFPEGTGKRVVLISDGNENLGNAEAQARIAQRNDIQIDVVPLAAGYRNQNEVLVQSVEAPPQTEQSSRVPIRVLIRSYNPHTVFGTLTLRQISEGQSVLVAPSPMQVRLRPGLNSIAFKQTLSKQQQSYTYEAVFQPHEVLEDEGGVIQLGKGDYRPENKRATTHVIAVGRRRVLLIEPKAGDHQLLLDRLRAAGTGESKFTVHSIEASRLPEDKADLGVLLSNYDCVILANVPAELLGEDQQEMLRSNTHEQGCGLIMIGGPDGFGAGGWQGTSLEKALPVDCDIKSIKVQGKGGLVLLMHASEMADGNRWQKEIAKLAIRKLSPADEVGILYFDWGATKWHIPLQVIGSQRDSLLNRVDKLAPGDMPEFDTGLAMAHQSLTEDRRGLTTKHVIIISDGDPMQGNPGLLKKMKQDKVTVTTVGVATHGAPQDQALANIAKATGGRFYNVRSPKALPAIYIKETRLVSQSFIYEKKFAPKLLFKSGPTEKLPDDLNALYGFVRTTLKVSPLVQMSIMAPPTLDQEFPILAYWHFGLGKSVAFTSDARNVWDRDWAQSDTYLKFWEQVVDWALRAVETGRMIMATEYRDGKVKVIVDARDDNNRPMTDLVLEGGVTSPSPQGSEDRKGGGKFGVLKFEQKNSGLYEAEFKADEAGSYFINAQARRSVKTVKDGKEVVSEESDSVRAGVTVPYSPEFADMESNAPLLEKLRSATGGSTFGDDDAELARAAASGEVFRRTGLAPSRTSQPIWYWLLLLCGVLLFFDVAVRRIAIDATEVVTVAERTWERLRGRAVVPVAAPQFLERLSSRKAQVDETFERLRGARRFESAETMGSGAPQGADEALASAPRPATMTARPAGLEPKKEEEPADYASRLLKAKQRVWEERQKDKERPS
jgi:uncharacterized membrane protein